jgi:hypothetical protein
MNRPQDKAEIEIRGKFLAMSCDIEYTLMNIMAYCAPDPQNQIRRFKKMMMGEKIQNTVHDLKHHKPIYFGEYENHLLMLEEFRVVRIDLSHHRMEFPDPKDLSTFRMIYVDEVDGIERLMYKDYTMTYYNECIERLTTMNLTLAGLVVKLYNDYQRSQGLPTMGYQFKG